MVTDKKVTFERCKEYLSKRKPSRSMQEVASFEVIAALHRLAVCFHITYVAIMIIKLLVSSWSASFGLSSLTVPSGIKGSLRCS